MVGDWMGAEEGTTTGPKAGAGASSIGHGVVGGEDFEGTPGDELPKREDDGDRREST
jgi:hypothetical protein